MKTYSEYCDESYVDWKSELKLILSGKKEPSTKLIELADSWETCPVGQSDVNVPRGSEGTPTDTLLCLLGQQFTKAVKDDRYEDANFLLPVIDARVEIVVANEKKRILEDIKATRQAAKDTIERLKILESGLNTSDDFKGIDVEISKFRGL